MRNNRINMIISFILLFSLSFCSYAESFNRTGPYDRIIGGMPANIQNFPYQLALENGLQGYLLCGAAIIHKLWAISAAHCVVGFPVTTLRLRAGSSYQLKGGTVHQVQKTLIHPHFNWKTKDYDVSLIKVSKQFSFSKVCQKIPLANRAPKVGTAAVISGWGDFRRDGTKPLQLQKATLYILDYNKCNKKYNNTLRPRMMCAGVPRGAKDACQGDSGGPLVSAKQLVGIVSWGRECGDPNFPGVYTNVPKVLRWVLFIIRKYPK